MRSKVVRKEYPRVRTIVKRETLYYQVDCRKKGYPYKKQELFHTREKAIARAQEIAKEVATLGMEGFNISLNDRQMILSCKEKLLPFGLTIEEAVDSFVVNHTEALRKSQSRLLGGCVDEYLIEKEQSIRTPLRSKSLVNLKYGGRKLKDAFPNKKIGEIEQTDIEKYLDNRDNKLSRRSIHTIKNLWSGFFNYAIQKKYIGSNPCKNVQVNFARTGIPEILTAEETQKLLKHCEETDPELVLYFAVCLFAGLRPSEAQSLEWKWVDLHNKQIMVPPHISKIKEDRIVTIEDNLLEWLKRYKKKPVLVTPQHNFRKRFDKIRQGLGYKIRKKPKDGKKWAGDILRHTYGSMWLAKYPDRAQLAELMGNSIGIIKRHYKKAVGKEEGERFWKIVPHEKTYSEKKAEQFFNLKESTQQSQYRPRPKRSKITPQSSP